MKKIFVIAALVIVAGIFIAWWYYTPQNRMNRVLNEVVSVPNMETFFLDEIESQECKSLEKDDSWTIKDCNGELYYKIFFKDDGFYLGYCAAGSAKEAFQKVGSHLTPPKGCASGIEEQLVMSENGTDIYKVCGLTVIFQGECITGVGE